MTETIGRYQVIEELGRGGMGVVYRARDPVIDRVVALKTMRNVEGLAPSVYEEMRERFLREARAAGRLQHPHVVTVLDADTDAGSGVSYIAMEFVAGRDLEGELRSGRRFEASEAAAIVASVAEALEHAHRQGIVHRDVKPANVLLDASGAVKVTDFGIARLAESGLTQTGQVLGSPAYMSPEQITGSPLDARSDIFSLGIVLYQLLTGERPFTGESMTTLSYQIVHVEPIPVRAVNPGLPTGYQEVVARALGKHPDERYETAARMAEELRCLARGEAPAPAARVGSGTMIDAAAPMSSSGATIATGGTGGATIATGGTRVAPAHSEPVAPPIGFHHRAPASTPSRGPLIAAAVGLSVLATLAVGGGLLAWYLLLRPAPGSTTGRPTAPPAAVARTPEPAREPQVQEPPESESGAESETARLFIDFEHHLGSGTVRVLVDDAEVWTSPLRARKQTKLRIPGWDKGPKLKLSNEALTAEVAVPAGVRRLTVLVAGSGVDDTEQMQGRLRSGRTNRLRIRVSRIDKKVDLSLQ